MGTWTWCLQTSLSGIPESQLCILSNELGTVETKSKVLLTIRGRGSFLGHSCLGVAALWIHVFLGGVHLFAF